MSRRSAMSVLALGTGAALLASCSSRPEVSAPPETRAERLAVVERIAAECQAPRAMIALVGEDAVRLNPGADVPYEKVECVLGKLDRLNLPPGKVSFAENLLAPEESNGAAIASEAGNAQAD